MVPASEIEILAAIVVAICGTDLGPSRWTAFIPLLKFCTPFGVYRRNEFIGNDDLRV